MAAPLGDNCREFGCESKDLYLSAFSGSVFGVSCVLDYCRSMFWKFPFAVKVIKQCLARTGVN